jgi:hypothetical protein
MPTAPRKPLLVNLAWAAALSLMLAVAYVASYPVAVRYTQQIDIVAYRPVQYLVDHTRIRGPIRWWADKCGTEYEVVVASDWRAYLADPSLSAGTP